MFYREMIAVSIKEKAKSSVERKLVYSLYGL
jgi:hypothetical protein